MLLRKQLGDFKATLGSFYGHFQPFARAMESVIVHTAFYHISFCIWSCPSAAIVSHSLLLFGILVDSSHWFELQDQNIPGCYEPVSLRDPAYRELLVFENSLNSWILMAAKLSCASILRSSWSQ